MSFTAPTVRTTAELITASIWNVDLVADLVALRLGSIAMASQATGDIPYASSGTQLDRLIGPSAVGNLQDAVIQRPELKDYSETTSAPAIAAGVLTLNMEASNTFLVALNAAITTLTISNPPANNKVGSFQLVFTADGTPRSVAWGASVKWPGAVAPTLTSTNGKKDWFVFITTDAGTTWAGFIAGLNI